LSKSNNFEYTQAAQLFGVFDARYFFFFQGEKLNRSDSYSFDFLQRKMEKEQVKKPKRCVI